MKAIRRVVSFKGKKQNRNNIHMKVIEDLLL